MVNRNDHHSDKSSCYGCHATVYKDSVTQEQSELSLCVCVKLLPGRVQPHCSGLGESTYMCAHASLLHLLIFLSFLYKNNLRFDLRPALSVSLPTLTV